MLYCCECRNANNTACLPSAETYSFAVKSLLRGDERRYRLPVCTVGRMRLYIATYSEASLKSSACHLFRFAPMPSAPCIATRKRNFSGVERPFMLGTSVTQADMIFGAYA